MTVRDTITRAIGMTGARPLGDTPDAAETAAALTAFQSMLLALPRPALTEVLISANYTAGENERITDTSGAATVTRPSTVTDATTGLVRPPMDGAIVEVASATTPTRHIFSAELKTWMSFGALALDDAQPFGPTMDEGLAAMLAVRLAGPVFQRQPDAAVVQLASEGRRRIRQRFRQPFTATTDPLLLSWSQRNGSTV